MESEVTALPTEPRPLLTAIFTQQWFSQLYFLRPMNLNKTSISREEDKDVSNTKL